jgi:hypothetical protein
VVNFRCDREASQSVSVSRRGGPAAGHRVDGRTVCAAVAGDVAWAASGGVSLAVFPAAYPGGHSYDRETVPARARTLCDPLNNVLPPATAKQWGKRSIGDLAARARETGCWGVRRSGGAAALQVPETGQAGGLLPWWR